ncbi:MAG TPA: rod shape-determining protein MreC, partial [Planctomycetaceae bacterium]|nr:rod shape-determining protein MreC [Planctomycetaceae bacterium]
CGLAAAGLLACLPAPAATALRGWMAELFRPGQRVVLAARCHGVRIVRRVEDQIDTAGKLAAARQRIAQLEEQNRRLAGQLAARAAGQSRVRPHRPDDRLLSIASVPARVLGLQARRFLHRQQVLGVGAQLDVEPEALVLESVPGVLDRGGHDHVEAGQLVLEGSRVWGKIVEVGPHTSVVRLVTEPGYRDLVRLDGPLRPDGRRRAGPRGVLEGTGRRLARIRYVPVTEPVNVGDFVYADSLQGITSVALLYGRVVRAERTPGSSYWEIWMEPAVEAARPEQVVVLRVDWNRIRVAERP